MDGFETTKKIKFFVKNENYRDAIMIAYSCSSGIEFE